MTKVDGATATLRIELYGEARVGGAAGHRLERKDAALLAYLALAGATPRARLAALLWPAVDEPKARANLRQRLSRLRRTAGELIDEREGVLALHSSAMVDEGAPGAVLLAEHDYDDCPAYAEWLDQRRDAQRRAHGESLAARAASLRESDPEEALRLALEWLTLEPESEAAYRQLIELYYLRGDIGSALAALDKCCAVLQRVYGVAPSEATLRLTRQIRAATEPALPPAVAIPVTLRRPPRMVGREAQLASARAALGRRHTLVVAGEAGLGKSRLIEELLASYSGTVVRMRCRPNDSLQPRHALARCLSEVERVCRPALAQPLRRELARLIPALGPAPEPMSSAAEVAALHAALCDFLDACQVAAGDLLIACDDLHFADPATIDALRVCIRPQAAAEGSAPGFVVATRGHGGSWQARDLLAALADSEHAEAIVLAPLRAHDCERLIGDLALGDARWYRMSAELHQHSGGNPALLIETLKVLVGRQSGATSARGLPVPATMQAALHERLQALSPLAADLAQLAAVAAEQFSLDLAQRALGLPRIALAPVLRELAAAQILGDQGFAHDLLAEALLDALAPARRERLHLSVAECLQAAGAAPALIAHHLIAGRDPVSALPQLRAAGRLAREAQRPDECARLLEETARIELARGGRAAGVAALADAFAMYMATSFVDDANRVYEQWQSLAQTTAERLRLHAERARQQAGFSYIDEALHHATLATELLAGAPDLDADLRAECLAAIAPALIHAGRAGEAVALADSLAPARAALSAAAELALLKGQAAALAAVGRHAPAIEALHKALARHEAGVEPIQEWETHARLSLVLGEAGRARQAATAARRSIDAGRRQLHFPTATSNAHMALAMALVALGRYRQALAYLLARRDYFRRTGWRNDGRLAAALAIVHLRLGAADQAAVELADVDPARLGCSERALIDLARAQLAVARGQDCAAHLERLLAEGGEQVAAARLRARLIAARRLPPSAALDEAQQVLAQARAASWPALVRSAAVVATGAAAAAGEPAEARRFAELATQHAAFCDRVLGYPPEVQWAVWRALRAAGERERAAVHRARALRWIERAARAQVPEGLRDAFLTGNAINRELIAGR